MNDSNTPNRRPHRAALKTLDRLLKLDRDELHQVISTAGEYRDHPKMGGGAARDQLEFAIAAALDELHPEGGLMTE